MKGARLSCLVAILALVACSSGSPDGSGSSDASSEAPGGLYKNDVGEDIGVALDIVLDNSGSMDDRASGDSRPKYKVAREAIVRMLDATDSFRISHPDFPVKVALHVFSGDVALVMPMAPYDKAAILAALEGIGPPEGGTAIGHAMNAARIELYKSGVFRKNMLVITDGQNTSGPSPDGVAREIFTRSEGGIGMYFVAFDTDAENLSFARDVRGEVIAASNAASLQGALNTLYQGRILAEKGGAVEPLPSRSTVADSSADSVSRPSSSKTNQEPVR